MYWLCFCFVRCVSEVLQEAGQSFSLCWSCCCFHSHTCSQFGLISTCSSTLITSLLAARSINRQSTCYVAAPLAQVVSRRVVFLVSCFCLSSCLLLCFSTSEHRSDQHSAPPASQLQHLLTVQLTAGPLRLASPPAFNQCVSCASPETSSH